jgi:ArsR family transcriptional regulator
MNMRSYDCGCCLINKSEFKEIVSLSSLIRIVSVESRLKLLAVLKNGEHCVCEIEKHLDMSQSLISHHLRDLKDAGLVEGEDRGQKVFYKLTKLGEKLMVLLSEMKEVKL